MSASVSRRDASSRRPPRREKTFFAKRSTWTKAPACRANSRSARTGASPASCGRRSSTRRSRAPSTWRSGPASPSPAERMSPPSTGTWSAICARGARFASTASCSTRTERSSSTSASGIGALNPRRWCAIALALATLGGCASPTDVRGRETVQLRTIVFSGHRYVADADLGLHEPVPLMIHGNARMFLMVTHEIGERLTGGPVPKVADYGYSAKGKGLIRVPLLRFGDRRITDLRNVPVFDYVPDGKSPAQGMVGVPFLLGERAAVDFSRDRLILGVE